MTSTNEAVDFIVSGLQREGYSHAQIREILHKVASSFNLAAPAADYNRMPVLKKLSNFENPSNCPGTL